MVTGGLSAAEAISTASDRIVTLSVAQFYANHPSLREKHGPEGFQQFVKDSHHHINHLAFAIRYDHSPSFVEYCRWFYVMQRSRNAEDSLSDFLELAGQEIRHSLGDRVWQYTEPPLHAALAALQQSPRDHALYRRHPINLQARTYLNTILKGKRMLAHLFILDVYRGGRPLRDIYLDILEPALCEVGRRWELNRISAAHEHLASSITLSVMDVLFSEAIALETAAFQDRDKQALVACLEGNWHDIGAHMVADLLYEAGYDAQFVGCDVPSDCLLGMISEKKPQIVGLSGTLPSNVEPIRTMIEQIRSDFIFYRPIILVGGLVFNQVEGLWKQVGADISGEDAGEAIDRLTAS